MFKFFRRHRTLVLISLAVCVVGLILFGAGGTSFGPSDQDVIVRVNDKKITGQDFERIYRAMSRQQTDTSPQAQQQLTGQALNELIRTEVMSDEAKRYGITVTDQELQMQLASVPAFQKDGRFDLSTYAQVVYRTFGTTPHEFEKNHRKDLLVRKLNLLIAGSIQASDAEAELEKQAMLAREKDAKVKAELLKDSGKIRDRVRERQVNLVFNDWLTKLNSTLKVSVVSERFKQRLSGAPPPAQ
jgi:peptidyl-prolyl cis-trans isomerase D